MNGTCSSRRTTKRRPAVIVGVACLAIAGACVRVAPAGSTSGTPGASDPVSVAPSASMSPPMIGSPSALPSTTATAITSESTDPASTPGGTASPSFATVGPSTRPPPPPTTDTIAYIRGTTGDEIHLVDPNGSDDLILWQNEDPDGFYEVSALSWKPDGTELAFSSSHENFCSINDVDVFSIDSQGGAYRRVTESPACAALATFPAGTVRIPVNGPLIDSFTGFIYFQGAPSVQQVSLSAGASQEIVFEGVADLGDSILQLASIIDGNGREFAVGTAVDVLAGGTVTTAPVSLVFPELSSEARSPSWTADGSQVGYAYGFNALFRIDARPNPIDFGAAAVPSEAVAANIVLHMAFGPTPETADRILFQGTQAGVSEGIYLATAGDPTSADQLFTSEMSFYYVKGLAWLPDGSGFVYSVVEGETLAERSSNLFVYDLTSGQSRRITEFEGEYAGLLSVSGDGQSIVFERAAEVDQLDGRLIDPDLWIVGVNGTGLRLLIEDARAPAWSR